MSQNATVTRRGFLAGTGSLAVGFSLSATLAEFGHAAGNNGGSMKVDSWVVVTGSIPGGTGALVTIYAGKVELGTGIETALSQMVAEELNVGMHQLAYVQGDTDFTPGSQGYTAGSKSIQNDGPPMRAAAAAAMQQLLSLAAAQFGVSVSQLRASGGRIGIGQTQTGGKTYGDLLDGQTLTVATPTGVPLKPQADYRLVGTSVPRTDLPAKFKGTFKYVSDLKIPGMVHARVVRPAGRNATFNSFKAATDSALAAVPGFLGKYQIGNLVFVVGANEYAAVTAQTLLSRGALAVNWTAGAPFVPQANLEAALQDPANVYATGDETAPNSEGVSPAAGNVDAALATAAATASATYFTPFQMHGGMGASCAVAKWEGGRVTVWSGTQGPYPLRAAVASLLGLPTSAVRVIYTEASGCYGHNGADDVAAEAALIAVTIGKPVRLQWTRAEEHGWEPLSSAMVHNMRGGVTGTSVVAWEHEICSATHNSRPNSGNSAGNLLPVHYTGLGATAGRPADAPALGSNAATRNGPVTYNFANRKLKRKFVKSFNLQGVSRVAALPLNWVLPRTTALRSLGGMSNSFANESFMDELAKKANADPVVFRMAHLQDARAQAVLSAAASQAGWGGPLAGAPSGFARGRGVSFLRYETVEAYVAVVAEVLVKTTTGAVRVTRVVVAHDCGQIINPDGLRNQIEGNVIQGVSRTLKEEVKYTGDRVTTLGWQDNPAFFLTGYPVINFDEVPSIDVVLIDRPEQVPWGAGEPVIGALPGAIGNAVANAVGRRVRKLPMLPATVLAAAPT